MLDRPLRGILPVMATAFTAQDSLDEAACRRIVAYNVEAGAAAIVTLGVASEFWSLTEAERVDLARLTVDQVAGAVPVIVGASGTSAATAAVAARNAAAAGADALMVMPPYLHRARPDLLDDYFRAVTTAADLPIVLQNSSPPFGHDLDVATIEALVHRYPAIRYVKEETRTSTHLTSALLDRLGDSLDGVIGGEGGRYMIQQHARGASAIMPTSIATERYVEIWRALEREEQGEARRAHAGLLPLINFFGLHGIEAYKEVLAMRGVVDWTRTRGTPFLALDDLDRAELRRLVTDAGLGPVTIGVA
ncbi:dihydrodipicolinate synthase family protein [Dactylosporangium sp. CA-139066]|uniref:dihydrodipicolinate synthase family protein n=1 Tax=Dactylosporangium sp. CA-139066 TaxID=3239930 RepID=UPI003D931FD3